MTTKAYLLMTEIRRALRAGGDSEHWDAPEFANARALTSKWGVAWEFTSWADTLAVLAGGELGGVDLSVEVSR